TPMRFFYCLLFFFASFFFQAEDGIRDPLVTGVQTCALPISNRGRLDGQFSHSVSARVGEGFHGSGIASEGKRMWTSWPSSGVTRSEERRVGKECRAGWARGRCRKRD